MTRWRITCSDLDMHGVPCGTDWVYDDRDAGMVAQIVVHVLSTGHEPDPAIRLEDQ